MSERVDEVKLTAAELIENAESRFAILASIETPYSGKALDEVFGAFEAAERQARTEYPGSAIDSFNRLGNVAERCRLLAVGADDKVNEKLFDGRRKSYGDVAQSLGSKAVSHSATDTSGLSMSGRKQ